MCQNDQKTVLVTAFEPFGGETLNPAGMILDRLPEEIAGCRIRKLLLPVEFVRSQELASAEYDRLLPDAVVMLGQAGGRGAVTPETTAKNLMNARIPDNAGYQPGQVRILKNGPDTLYSTLPTEKIFHALSALGIPCEVSDDAGEYVCNRLFYGMLGHVDRDIPTGFIHVPYIREQGHEDKPFMEFEDEYRGILAAVEAVSRILTS